MKHIIFAVTGGSGAPIAKRMLELLLAADDVRVTMIVSDYARDVFRAESGIDFGKTQAELAAGLAKHFSLNQRFELMDVRNMAARVSSGSALNEGMIIVTRTSSAANKSSSIRCAIGAPLPPVTAKIICFIKISHRSGHHANLTSVAGGSILR